jgi:hypothetical protein
MSSTSFLRIQNSAHQQEIRESSNDSSNSSNDDEQKPEGSISDNIDTDSVQSQATLNRTVDVFSNPFDEIKAFTALALESLAQAAAGKNSEQFISSKDGMCHIYVKVLINTCIVALLYKIYSLLSACDSQLFS